MRRSCSRRSARRYDRWGVDPLVRPGPALAPLPRLPRRRRRRPTPCSTSRPERPPSPSSSSRQKDCYVVGVDRTPEMLEEGRRRVALAAATQQGAARRGRRARSCRSRTGSSTHSRSPTCCATSTTRPRPCASSRGWCKPRRDDRGARVRRPTRDLAAALGGLGTRRPAGRGPADRRRLARGRHVPRPVDHRALRAVAAAAAARRVARRRHRGRRARATEPRRRGGDVGTQEEVRPAFYALRRGGWRDYVTLLHPPYTLWHLSYVAIGAALAPHFHLDRLLWALARVLPRDGRRGARARRAEGPPAPDADPERGARRARRRLARRRGRDRHRRGERLGLRAARVRRRRRRARPGLQPRARASTTTGASRSPGARFRR